MNNLDFNAACLDVGLKPKLGPYSLEAPRRVGDMWRIVDCAWAQRVPDCVAACLNEHELERVLVTQCTDYVLSAPTADQPYWEVEIFIVKQNRLAIERGPTKREALLAAYKAMKEKP